jgi:signal transduction histidine kinase
MLGSAFRWSLVPIILPLVVIQAGALWWRRSHPVPVLVVVVAATLVWWVTVPSREPGSPALPFAVYAVSAYDSGRVRLWVAGIAIAMIAAAIVLLILGNFPITRDLLPAAATSLVAWVIGDYMRSRRRFAADMLAHQDQERAQAAEEERLRIARELHDVVAHNVSAMAIQAGAARVAGTDSKEALAGIEQSARDTLSELNKLLGVLRKTGDAPLTPQPTLSDAETLLRPAREAGLQTAFRVTGDRKELPAAVELSAYRIIQEAVTNVLKHANASRVEVTVDYGATALNLTIADNGSGPANASPNGSGHGLIGMRERVELFGGDLSTGSSSLGGFVVRATLPVKA